MFSFTDLSLTPESTRAETEKAVTKNIHTKLVSKATPKAFSAYYAHKAKFQNRWPKILEPLVCMFFVAPSRHKVGKVSYFASLAALQQGRSTATAPEMFAQRMLKNAPRYLVEAWEKYVIQKLAPTITYIPNNNPEAWVAAYRNGPHSCMQNSPLVAAYAHPDNKLALAVLQDTDDSTYEIKARTIVHTERKTYLRIYSFEEELAILFAKTLEKEGYKRDPLTLLGERIYAFSRSCHYCDNDYWAAPYLDGEAQMFRSDLTDPMTDRTRRTLIVTNNNFPGRHLPSHEYDCGEHEDDYEEDDDDDEY